MIDNGRTIVASHDPDTAQSLCRRGRGGRPGAQGGGKQEYVFRAGRVVIWQDAVAASCNCSASTHAENFKGVFHCILLKLPGTFNCYRTKVQVGTAVRYMGQGQLGAKAQT